MALPGGANRRLDLLRRNFSDTFPPPPTSTPSSPQTLYVGSEGGGVFKSSNGGDHWLAVNSELDELTVDGLAMDPSNPTVLCGCGPNGVYKTITGGEVRPVSSSIRRRQ